MTVAREKTDTHEIFANEEHYGPIEPLFIRLEFTITE